MRGRYVAVAMALAMLVLCLVPFCSEDSAADDPAPESTPAYRISVPGYSNPGHYDTIKMKNGDSKTIVIYVLNESDRILDVAFYTINVGLKSYVHSDWVTNMTLMPVGDKNGKDMLKFEYVLTADEVMPSVKDENVTLNIYVTDVSVDEQPSVTTLRFKVTVDSSYDVSENENKFFGVVDNDLPAPFDTPITPFLVTLLVYILASIVIMKLLLIFASRFMQENASDRERKVARMTIRTAVFFFALGMFMDLGVRILNVSLNSFFEFHKISVVIMVVMAAILIWQLYSLIMDYVLWKMGQVEESFIDPSILPIFSVVGKILLWVFGIGIILHVYGMDLSGILLSAGIVTLGITLGAQSVLSQFFSGISLLLTRPFSRGEYVEMNGHTYIVKRVKLMYTEFYGVEKDRVITMPNNAVASSTIINMSKYDKAYRMYINFDIPSTLNVKKVEKIMIELAEESPYVLHDDKYKKPGVKFIDFKGSTVQMRLDVTIRNFEDLPEIQSEMKKDLFVRLAEAGMEASYSKLKVSVEENGPIAPPDVSPSE